jgi:aryl-alcohol dehydrogenase-like predicted oxidoreductase
MGMGTTTWQKWVVGEDASVAIVKKALDLGINFFDTADSYSGGKSEEYLGLGLKAHTKRDQVL